MQTVHDAVKNCDVVMSTAEARNAVCSDNAGPEGLPPPT